MRPGKLPRPGCLAEAVAVPAPSAASHEALGSPRFFYSKDTSSTGDSGEPQREPANEVTAQPNLSLLLIAAIVLCSGLLSVSAAQFTARDESGVITIATPNYRLEIQKKGFRYRFVRPDGQPIAPAHASSGLEFAGAAATDTALRSQGQQDLVLDVTNDQGAQATVQIEPAGHAVRLAITAPTAGRVIARTAGLSPAFGLGDHAGLRHSTTEISNYTNDHFQAQEPPGDKRLISDFLVFPRQGIAMVNMEKGLKVIRVTPDETTQGTVSTLTLPALYYFVGTPTEIYAAYLEARNREGYPVYRPKYEFFGVGWEAFGALGWKTNEKTVTENVERYLGLGYPLAWMVVGSGFWPNEDLDLCATTSFGLWDKTRYPDPRRFIDHFRSRGLKFFLGLRISFIKDGPYSAEGVAKGYFLTENGTAKAYKLGFPRRPAYLLDGSKPEAVKWYVGLCQKWRDWGVDGFKEDLFGYRSVNMREGNIDAVNRALMDQGVFIMGRNGYLGSAMDTHRINDFNFNEDQDRGPINGLAFAYSGFPYVYPDITGGTFGEGRKLPPLTDPRLQNYMMRVAQFDSVHPSMAMGMGPWNFGSKQVEAVMLGAAQLHARLHPYIYSAAIDAYETGFPWTMAPLPLVYPNDPQVYGRENSTVRGYEWLLGPSLLACPLYGNDYATATTRDVYLPAGNWMDYDTGEVHTGPKLLPQFPLPPGKTPLFVGGKGVLVLRDLKGKSLQAKVYPVAAPGSDFRFTHADGKTRSRIVIEATNWEQRSLAVTDTGNSAPVAFEFEPQTREVSFVIQPDHDYRVASQSARKPGEPASQSELKIPAALTAGTAAGLAEPTTNRTAQRIYRIMPVGDSITEGGLNFVSYRYPLWDKLFAAGYLIEYVGSRTNQSRIGRLYHEGYSGKTAELPAKTAARSFQKHPADIVLLHAGHNHSAEQQPVDRIVAANASLIESFRAVNPQVIVLLAQVIPSGKLPKYAYIPQLNQELGKLAERLSTAQQPVILVNQAGGFDWHTDTIDDKVHPNARGAEKMAACWFEALTRVMEKPKQSFHPRIVPYKQVGNSQLTLHVFAPPDKPAPESRPAIVFFFGGGWKVGTPVQFYPECAHFAAEGLVAISADYRIATVHKTTPFESVADGKSAIRWIRQHAKELGIDPQRIIAAGASAGGHVAAATGMVPGLDDPGEDHAVSSKPNALLLWYAVVDNGPEGYGYPLVGARYREISPLHNVTSNLPPTLFFLGTKDALIPVQTAVSFKQRIEETGGRCDLKLFEGARHGIYEYRKGDSPLRHEALSAADDFLASLGFLPAKPNRIK